MQGAFDHYNPNAVKNEWGRNMQQDDMMRERENERNRSRRMIAHLLANLLGGGSPTGEQMEACLGLTNKSSPAKAMFETDSSKTSSNRLTKATDFGKLNSVGSLFLQQVLERASRWGR